MEDSQRLSKAVRSLIQVKDWLLECLRCEVRNGQTALFWFDSWNDMGPLLTFVGDAGPRQLRLRLTATVADAARNGEWNLPAARSPRIEALQIALTAIAPPDTSLGEDRFLWIQSNGNYGPAFSTKVTWNHIRTPSPTISWAKVVWFKEHIPRNSFISWLALLRRLPTRDRLRSWGMNVPAQCVLCNGGIETHHHLFFECSYSSSIWSPYASQVWANPPQDIHAAAAWILLNHGSSSPQARCIIKLILQSSVYFIWKERNLRIFTGKSSPASVIIAGVDRQIRDRLLSIPPSLRIQPSFLQFFLSFTRPP
ncbi:uncharacterized protein LOC130512479 [Raphanus sativus]|uniref:Uncharacterized protein LOC130512479 n=1 Tax=Raphanus sativus TaxID=3726 RepID=A0A9W3DSA3_RAPSA|nr:uncharacterized protein LOC130512479 [Raphanus sativus]